MNQAMNILLDGKTDTELLDALVFALTENDNAALTEYAKHKLISPTQGANIEVVRHICRYVLFRSKSVAPDETGAGYAVTRFIRGDWDEKEAVEESGNE